MHFWTLFASFIISVSLTFVVHKAALRFNINPKKDYRRQQKGEIALWGGLSLYLAMGVGYFIWPQAQLLMILLPATVLIFVGMLDDRHEIKAITKFAAQFIAASAWLYFNDGPNLLLSAGISPLIGLPISTLWIVGLCNAFNLIDGTDGQSSIVGLLGFVLMGVSFPTLLPISAILVGVTIGFLVFNFPPAKIYLGESGSTFLGFCMATLTLSLPVAGPTLSFPIILGALYLVAFPLTDTVLAMGRRKLNKRPLFSGDKDHIHHTLQKMGFSKIQILMIVGFMVLFGDLTAYNLFQTTSWSSALILTLNNACLMSFVLYGLHYTKKVAAQKISYFGTSLLEKHIPHLNQEPIDIKVKKAYLLDLLPYYSELQSRGIATIVGFVKEISEQLSVNPNYSLYSVGSYSIAVIYKESSSWKEDEKHKINQKLKELLLSFEVLRSLSETPEGLQYFEEKNISVLLDMIPAFVKELGKAPLRIAG